MAEDSEDDYELLLRELRRSGYQLSTQRVASADALATALEAPWDLVISDWAMPGFSGQAVLEMLTRRKLDTPCIVVSGTSGEEPAIEAVRGGALDFLSKDKPRRFGPAVDRALREAADRRARLAAEHELRLSEERYRMGFEVAPEALLTYDLERRVILDANSKAIELFKRDRESLRTIPLGGLSPPNQPDGRPSVAVAGEHIQNALGGHSPSFPWTYLIEGLAIPTETRIIHLPTTDRNLARISIVDLRERVRSEEIRRRSAELELQNRRIQEASRLKSEFLANMSHELRTPLNAIIGFAELLHDGEVEQGSPTYDEFLGDILTSGRHLLQLINDVLDLAKVEAGKLEFRPEPVDLGKLLGEVTAILRTTLAQKRLGLETMIDPALAGIVLDPSRFKQVAYNYVSNAIKFTQPGGRIAIRARPEGDEHFRFEVEDSGVGIAASDLGRLFVEFQQLETGVAKRHQGTGLGLALTRRLVESQGGSVGVRSTLGEGSTFHTILPRHATVTIEPSTMVVVPVGDGRRSVLVVEDDARDQAQLVSALANAGYSVELAGTGAEALRRWRSRTFDAITIDLLLPDMSGLDLLAALHGEERSRHRADHRDHGRSRRDGGRGLHGARHPGQATRSADAPGVAEPRGCAGGWSPEVMTAEPSGGCT
ncbi:MAG: response regulator [Deltaproteobacteria bacterium]|nr:response regulator [Deltaproteobacteria bacterium]MDQ3297713.1 response regulator [Myxococcota bacterium]